MPVSIGPGWTIGAGVLLGGSSAPIAGVDNVVGYNQMPPPVIAGRNVEDPNTSINGSIGFTITDSFFSSVNMFGLSASNQAWFAARGAGTYTVTWGPGSTLVSSEVEVQIAGDNGELFFVILGRPGFGSPATYNYPFTFS
jgi:hypothetical protein